MMGIAVTVDGLNENVNVLLDPNAEYKSSVKDNEIKEVVAEGLDVIIPVKPDAKPNINVDFDEKIEIVGGEAYKGDYVVTPSPSTQIILDTDNKFLSDDVVVRKIPYEAVSNEQGGKTVTIGGY